MEATHTPAQQHWMNCLTRLGLFSGLLLAVLWFGWLQWSVAAYRSVQIKATLVSVGRTPHTVESDDRTIRVIRDQKLVVEYRYTYKGNNFLGNQVAFGSRWFGHQASSDLKMQRAVDSLRTSVPKSIRIWVDPDDPKESALLQRTHPGLIYVTLFMTAALAIGVLNALFEVMKLTKARRAVKGIRQNL